jgi:hypothetical protein
MTGLKIIVALILGAAHRRAFGGWLGIRGAIMRPTPALWSAPFWCLTWGRHVTIGGWEVFGYQLPALLAPGWAVAAICTAAIWLHWNDGHRFDKPWKLSWRYGWAPVVVSVMTAWWPAVAVGPVVALSAAGLRWLNPPALWLPWDWTWEERLPDGSVETREMRMVDGWEGYWELVRGGASSAAFVAAALIGLGR